jgi:hypothetical protein
MIWAIWERATNRNISFRYYVIVFLVFGFVAASFQTWRQEQKERLTLTTTQPAGRNPDVVQHLRQLYSEASDLHRRALQLINAPDEEFKKLQDEATVFGATSGKWILENMGQASIRPGYAAIRYGFSLRRSKPTA